MKTNHSKQQSFFTQNSKFKLCHGGELRKRRLGRLARPLSYKEAHHIVFKIHKNNLQNKSFRHPKNFAFIQRLMARYSKMFFVKIEQISYQHDHIHIIARSSRRSHFHHFFRVFAGQIAQNIKVTDTPKLNVVGRIKTAAAAKSDGSDQENAKAILWKWRPFTRVVKGWKNYITLKNYVQLNEKEVTGVIQYSKERLRGLSAGEWQLLWS